MNLSYTTDKSSQIIVTRTRCMIISDSRQSVVQTPANHPSCSLTDSKTSCQPKTSPVSQVKPDAVRFLELSCIFSHIKARQPQSAPSTITPHYSNVQSTAHTGGVKASDWAVLLILSHSSSLIRFSFEFMAV